MTLRHSMLIITLAFGAGLAFTLWKQDKLSAPAPPSPVKAQGAEQPVPELRTDAFTLRLLHAAMQSNEGNILLLPHALTGALSTLHKLSDGATKPALEALQLSAERLPAAEKDGEATLFFADRELELIDTPELEEIMPVAMGEQWADGLQMMNNLMTGVTGEQDTLFLTGDNLSPETKLLGICNLSLRPVWQLPLRAQKENGTDFFNANGSMPRIRALQCSGLIRHAKAEDGTWQAVALYLKLSPASAEDTCLLLIMPGGNSARDFALALTPELMTTIRKAVANAEPTFHCVEFPRIIFNPPTQEMRPVLEQLGLQQLFTPEADLSRLTADKPCALHAILQKCRIPLAETETSLPDDVADIRFDKPFLWLIGPLSTPAPPYALGVVENM
ncbi:MAG: hypothetical protein IKV82_03085 [Akkermansia sp.]|nr:hypothetical protein [Akkermansia sp.]